MRRPRRILYAGASDEDVASTKIIQHGITIVKSSNRSSIARFPSIGSTVSLCSGLFTQDPRYERPNRHSKSSCRKTLRSRA